MNTLVKSGALSIGLALFSMFFGAGNIIFPLSLGHFAGDKTALATTGFIITATLIPLAGVIAMIMYNGSYREFFGQLGRIPGTLLALITISLLGPLGSTPRCIALSYTTLNGTFFDISPMLFSAISCIIILLFTIRKNYIIALLGWVLTPILLISLTLIIILGLINAPTAHEVTHDSMALFWHGLKEGYNTMDLLAAFFFSSSVVGILNQTSKERSKVVSIALSASFIAAILLSLVYVGFSLLAAYHGISLGELRPDELLGAITVKVAGPYAGLLVNVAVVFACLTTAIALICAFTDFMQKEIFNNRFSYEAILVGSLLVTFFVASFEFTSISAFLGPVLKICYPGLIVLTFLNIGYKLGYIKWVALPVFATFAISALIYFW